MATDSELRPEDLQLVRQIAQSGSAVIRLVRHTPSDLLIAQKFMPLGLVNNPMDVLSKIRALYEHQHPNIINYYGAFFNTQGLSILLEYMDLGSLADMLQQRGPISEAVLGVVSAKALQGLHYLHRVKHEMHRDLRPGNILLNRAGEVKITDFGMTWMGTQTYMSPERIQGLRYPLTSDIWSFGLTIAECAMGEYPYRAHGGNAWEVLDRIVEAPAPSLPADRFSPECCSFVSACLEKNPDSRPSAEDLLQHPFIAKYAESSALAEWIATMS